MSLTSDLEPGGGMFNNVLAHVKFLVVLMILYRALRLLTALCQQALRGAAWPEAGQ